MQTLVRPDETLLQPSEPSCLQVIPGNDGPEREDGKITTDKDPKPSQGGGDRTDTTGPERDPASIGDGS